MNKPHTQPPNVEQMKMIKLGKANQNVSARSNIIYLMFNDYNGAAEQKEALLWEYVKAMN